MLCGCGHAFVFINLEARHHLINNGIGVLEDELVDGAYCFSEFKVIFAEVVLEVGPRLVCVVCTFSCADVIFEDPLFLQDDKGEVDCLDLGQFHFFYSCVFHQVVNRGEYYFDGLYWVIDHCFDGGGLVVKLLGGDEAVIVVKVLKDGWDE